MSFFSGRRQTDTEADDQTHAHPIGFDTVLGASSVLDGTLKSEGNIRLDGTFSGKLDITGNVLVGETAEINADIEARNISIAGTVRGNVTGVKVQLLKTGRIWGDINASSLTTEDGAFIEGKIAMQVPESGPTSDEPVTEPANDDTVASKEEDALDKTHPDLGAGPADDESDDAM